jgi:hypothetical protein
MSHLMLHAQQIRKLTLEKQHIASIAWELDLYSMQSLSASAYRVWHFIRAFAAFDTQCYSAKLSQEYIAEKLKCSVKTVSRAISEIKNVGLVDIQSNVSRISGTQANTYFITFPKEAYVQAEATANKVVKFPLPCAANNTGDTTISTPSSTLDIDAEPLVVRAVSKSLSVATTLPRPNESKDTIDLTPPVKSDVHNRDYNFIEKNNKIVVFNLFNQEEKQEDVLPQQIKLTALLTQLKDEKQDLRRQLIQCSQFKSTDDRLSLLKNVLNNRLDSDTTKTRQQSSQILKQLDDLDIKIEQVSKQVEKVTVALKWQQKNELLYQDPTFVNKLEGDRQLSEQDIQLVLTKLKALNVSTETKNQLANEVIYEARFGSLVKNNQTQDENPIKRSINIGCKLIRAGQWCRPTKFDQIYKQA